jgi:SAM-dependent methyltransferase
VSEAEAWNKGSHEWVERIRSGMGGRVHAHDASLYALLPPPVGLTIDAGCGEGRVSRELASRGYDVIGFDASETLVGKAREAHPDGRYEVASIDALPVADGSAQLVVCVNVLPHVRELEPAARGLARVLAPGGRLLIGTIHPVAQAGTYDEETGELRVRGYFDRDLHPVELGEYRVHHQHRTIEDQLRTFLAVGFALTDLREVAGHDRGVPLYLDLLFARS